MIQEDLGRPNFQSPPISEKLAPDRRSCRDDSNGVHFTSNGLYMRKLSRSVLWGQQVKLAKRGATWHPLTGWHMESILYKHDDMEPLTGWHVASIQYRQMAWQLYSGSTVQSGCDTCHVQTMRWKSSQQYRPIWMRHVLVRRWLCNLVGSTVDELAADWALRWKNMELSCGSTGLANIDWSSPKCCCFVDFELLTSHTLSLCLYQLRW